MLGVAVLIATVLLVAPHQPVATSVRRSTSASGSCRGVLNTSLSTNGPPLVFDLQARHLAPDPFRATISTVFALSNVVGLTLFVADGKVTADGLVAAAVALPAWSLGQLLRLARAQARARRTLPLDGAGPAVRRRHQHDRVSPSSEA